MSLVLCLKEATPVLVDLIKWNGPKVQVLSFNCRYIPEVSSQISYKGEGGTTLYYYRGSRGGIVDLVLERRDSLSAIKLLFSEIVDRRELQGLLAWKKKEPRLNMFALGGLYAEVDGVKIFPWKAIG